MKCIVCGEDAEYVLVTTLPIPMGISVTAYVYGGSYCKKHFLEYNKKAQGRIKTLMEASGKLRKALKSTSS